ncbi:hypothetical protein AEGHOMDF_2263 [Methylobacterium soli]|nr:hypothetical protein AEGHOMDF_2263 [Methylobacterium soli]
MALEARFPGGFGGPGGGGGGAPAALVAAFPGLTAAFGAIDLAGAGVGAGAG